MLHDLHWRCRHLGFGDFGRFWGFQLGFVLGATVSAEERLSLVRGTGFSGVGVVAAYDGGSS